MSAMRPYVIRQGEYLAKIAFAEGFDADAVWTHDKNKELKERRKTHWILYPGDVVFVPDSEHGRCPAGLESSNEYSAKVPHVWCNFVFRRGNEALANARCDVEFGGQVREETTRENGGLSVRVPTIVRDVIVTFHEHNLQFWVSVGDLDPADEPGGKEQRLENMGYLREEPTEAAGLEGSIERRLIGSSLGPEQHRDLARRFSEGGANDKCPAIDRHGA